eukprot:TRINITY_DN65089_c0_g1_i1.p1 TRINITY_DN65089_c0_g1~~TRINITY_DN65089_c0_g1_i1.p1  ORF type:complete len:541 (-),score=147.75 TRINITY_DN65089_c0_g1_i1:67-1689(-)
MVVHSSLPVMASVPKQRGGNALPKRRWMLAASVTLGCSFSMVLRGQTPGFVGGRGASALSGAAVERRAALRAAVSDAPVVDAELLTEEDVAPEEQAAEAQSSSLPELSLRPGQLDDASFQNGASVERWRSFDANMMDDNNILEGVDLNGDTNATAYWLYHLGRSGFFSLQGILGVQTSNLAARLRGVLEEGEQTVDFNNLVRSPKLIRGLLKEAVQTFKQDLGYIEKGDFKAPFDMSPTHRQWSPGYILGKSLRFFSEAADTLIRKAQKADTRVWIEPKSKVYPDYYLHTFHYQTDGWLSSRSAQVYEASTETLFIGRQDAMQRSTIPHIAQYLRENPDKQVEDVQLLEMACGTGRLMTYIRDNWPDMKVVANDLSPYYLEEARKNNAYWERRFAPKDLPKGRAAFTQANAEDLPFADEQFDVVLSVYLFHELPAEAQDAVFAEATRLLKPGGVFVVTDSMQLGDRPVKDERIGIFGDFAEPYYRAFIQRDLAKMASANGLTPWLKEISSVSKSLSFRKPALEEEPAEDWGAESATLPSD